MPSHDGVALIEARGLQRSYGRLRVLRGLDLSLAPGEALAIIGPNGAGKTTLLRLLSGLLRPDAGVIRVLGERLVPGAHGIRKAIGLLSHHSLLYDDLTLQENLTFAARLYGLAQPRQTADAALRSAELTERGSELPRRLSRGLLQRAALARALLHSPALILLDEPFTALDAGAAERLRADLQNRLTRGAAMVVVTHQLGDVWELATRVAVLIRGQWAADQPRSGTLDTFLGRYRAMADG